MVNGHLGESVNPCLATFNTGSSPMSGLPPFLLPSSWCYVAGGGILRTRFHARTHRRMRSDLCRLLPVGHSFIHPRLASGRLLPRSSGGPSATSCMYGWLRTPSPWWTGTVGRPPCTTYLGRRTGTTRLTWAWWCTGRREWLQTAVWVSVST